MSTVPSLKGGTALSRHILSLSHEQLTACDLNAFVAHADALTQLHCTTCTTLFPKAPSRWLSHDPCRPRPLTLTTEGDVEGGLSGLVGATLDFRLTRSLCAPHSGTRGGPCDDPASLVVLEVAAKVEQYVDDARFCDDRHQVDKGPSSRALAGLHDAIPGEDALGHVRSRLGAEAIDTTMAAVVDLLSPFGLLKGARLSTDGQLEASYARSKGGPYACEAWRSFRVDEVGQQERRRQWQRGAKRLQLPCPCPDVVAKVRQATAKQGQPKAPKVALLEREDVPDEHASSPDRQQIAPLLGRSEDEVPAVRLTWCHVKPGPQGELLAPCPKVPSDLAAKIGSPIDTTDPSKNESVCGSRHLKSTAIHRELGLAWPLGHATYAADAHEGTHGMAHRAALAVPVRPGPVPVGDAASEGTANAQGMRDRGGSAVFDSNPRHAHLDPESLAKRGDDPSGTPSAPCGRLGRSNGDDDQANSRH